MGHAFTRRYSEMETARAAVQGDIVYGKYKPANTGAERPENRYQTRQPEKHSIVLSDDGVSTLGGVLHQEELLDATLNEWGHISHIGAKRRMGHGLIQSINIEEDTTALTAWQKRTMPWPLCNDVVPMRCTTQNPYFDKTRAKDGYCHIEAL